jgi:hypothetical protein
MARRPTTNEQDRERGEQKAHRWFAALQERSGPAGLAQMGKRRLPGKAGRWGPTAPSQRSIHTASK